MRFGTPWVRTARLICQGCGRKGPPGLSVGVATRLAYVAGWTTSEDHGRPCPPAWCRRCADLIVAGEAQP